MPLYMKMSENINEATRHLKFRYISILTNLPRTDNETKSIKTITTKLDQLKKIKRTKSRAKRNIKMLTNRSEKIPYVQVKQNIAKS